jgi:hypothetical protein
MSFEDLARSFLAPADPEDIMELAEILQGAYCAGLRACAWRSGGILYLFTGPSTRSLDDALKQVRDTGKPL